MTENCQTRAHYCQQKGKITKEQSYPLKTSFKETAVKIKQNGFRMLFSFSGWGREKTGVTEGEKRKVLRRCVKTYGNGFYAGYIYSWKLAVFLKLRVRKTVHFSEDNVREKISVHQDF